MRKQIIELPSESTRRQTDENLQKCMFLPRLYFQRRQDTDMKFKRQ